MNSTLQADFTNSSAAENFLIETSCIAYGSLYMAGVTEFVSRYQSNLVLTETITTSWKAPMAPSKQQSDLSRILIVVVRSSGS